MLGHADVVWSVDNTDPNDDWIYDLRGDRMRQCQFLVRYKIVQPPVCPRCNIPLRAVLLQTNREQQRNYYSYRWRCPSDECDIDLIFTHGSYLLPRQKPVFKHIQLLYKFYLRRNATDAAKETEFGVTAAQKWFKWYRLCISHYMQHFFYPRFQFGIDGAIQFDEAALSAKQKHHRGRR